MGTQDPVVKLSMKSLEIGEVCLGDETRVKMKEEIRVKTMKKEYKVKKMTEEVDLKRTIRKEGPEMVIDQDDLETKSGK